MNRYTIAAALAASLAIQGCAVEAADQSDQTVNVAAQSPPESLDLHRSGQPIPSTKEATEAVFSVGNTCLTETGAFPLTGSTGYVVTGSSGASESTCTMYDSCLVSFNSYAPAIQGPLSGRCYYWNGK